MFTYEYTAKGCIDVKKVWDLFSDVSQWPSWEPFVETVAYEGTLRPGAEGVKKLKNGQPLPFRVESVTQRSGYVLSSDRGPMHIVTEYFVTEQGVGEKYTITGGTDIQRSHLGGKMTASIPENMEKLAKRCARRTGMASRQEALSKFFDAWSPEPAVEYVPLSDAVGRVLAETQYSAFTLPIAHVSGCDGIAVHSEAFQDGIPDTGNWVLGQDYVMADTGDDFPDAFDAVIAIEQLNISDGKLSLCGVSEVKPGASTRPRGSIIREGDVLLEAHQTIRPTDLGALTMGGADLVPVFAKPKVVFIPTGSELVSPGTVPERGQIVDSNSLMVTKMIEEMGGAVMAFPPLRDVQDNIQNALTQAVKQADLVIVNGGSSKGGEDYCTRAICSLGQIIQYQIAAVPGRPMALAMIDGTPVVNLPGPPLAAYFGTDWCIRALLGRWFRQPVPVRQTVTGCLTAPLHGGAPVEILHRMQATKDSTGNYFIRPLSRSDSSAAVLSSNAQYVMPIRDISRNPGDTLEVELLRGIESIPTV